MSMSEWPILIYGINIKDLDFKANIDAFEDIMHDKPVSDELQEAGLSWSIDGEGNTYIGCQPEYGWNMDEKTFTTKEAADDAIANFFLKYVTNSKEDIIGMLEYIETVGWG